MERNAIETIEDQINDMEYRLADISETLRESNAEFTHIKNRFRSISEELDKLEKRATILFSIILILISVILSISLVHIFGKDDSIEEIETTEKFVIENHTPAELIAKEMEMETETNTYYDIPLSKDLQDYIFEVSEKNNIDHKLVIAIIRRESNYEDSAVGDNGLSFGLMQIQKRYSVDRMKKLGMDDLLDPYQNIAVGIDILRELFDTGKSIEWVLMAYNGGPSSANRHVNDGVVTDYAKTVLEYRNNL